VSTVLELHNVRKQYQALRPLRLRELTIGPAERVAIAGLDGAAAELLVNLVTGASLPDEGEVRIFGRNTASISNGDEWLVLLERFGILSDRAVLLEGSTLEQNIAMPITLEIDPLAPETARRVNTLAAECGIGDAQLRLRTGDVSGELRARVHLARAIALDPALLVLEHPTARVEEHARAGLGDAVARVAGSRGLPALMITNDDVFARRAASRRVSLDAATGNVMAVKRGWLW
jgi:phospholipid/cholesterol/gamma-HCH transport system ATP-binding protein